MAMLPEIEAAIPQWKARKQAQVDRARENDPDHETLGGLSFSTYGPRGSTFAMMWAGDDLQEMVVIGQLPQIEREPVGKKRNGETIFADVTEERKQAKHRDIDLSDGQVDLVLECWRRGQSALDLNFIPFVWGPNGKRRDKRR